MSALNVQTLCRTLAVFSTSVSVSRTRLTSTAGGGVERALRPVQCEWDHRIPQQSADWITYRDVVRLHAPPSFETAWETESETLTLLVSVSAFDGGGDRNVFHAHFEGSKFE